MPSPFARLPIALAADALISGIESKREFLTAGMRIGMYGSKSEGSEVSAQILPMSCAAIYFELLSCIMRPQSRRGTRRLRDGASILCTKLVSSNKFNASFKCFVELESARIIISSMSPTSGHLMTEPIFEIASMAAT